MSEKIPPTCQNCQRLEALVDKVINAGIDAIAGLHVRPPGGATREQEVAIHQLATNIFMTHLREVGLLPGSTPKKSTIEIVH